MNFVRSATEMSDRFERPADFTVESVLQQGHVFVRDAPAEESLVVRYPLADESWAIRHVLQYGPDAVIIAPEQVRREMELVLERSLNELPP